MKHRNKELSYRAANAPFRSLFIRETLPKKRLPAVF
jgi:hypothetical protein